MNTSIEFIHTEMTEIKLNSLQLQINITEIKKELATVKEVKASLEFTQAEVVDMKSRMSDIEVELKAKSAQIDSVVRKSQQNEQENKFTLERMLKLDSYVRRENLILQKKKMSTLTKQEILCWIFLRRN